MATSAVSFQDAGERLLTIRQQINNLKAWNKSQENKLILQKSNKYPSTDTQRNATVGSDLEYNSQNNRNGFDEIEEQPLVPVHKNFEALLIAKLNEERNTEDETNHSDKSLEKRPFLKKGEGLSRFRMKPEDFKLKHRKPNSAQQPSSLHSSCDPPTNKSDALKAFEALEDQANNASFCSTSSMVEQLMEDSIKSTPVKLDDSRERHLRLTQEQYATCRTQSCENEANYEFYGIRMLDIIDEEPSRFDESSKDYSTSECNLMVNRSTTVNEYSDDNVSESGEDDQTSKCSCCLDTSRFLSASVASVSVYEETTTVYTPIKSTMQNRLKELEAEIDAFRSENAHLSQLRSEYEAEYTKFCEEKKQILSKIRAEHLTELKELEQEKKKLQREKFAFEKYVKENRNRPNKEEKEEMRVLKEEIKSLKQKLNEKESRWAAAQARIRSEMKQLKDHNATLKEEVEKLRKSSKNVSAAPSQRKSKTNLLRKIDQELATTEKTIEKFKTPPSSPDSGLDTFEETKIEELNSELANKLDIGDNEDKKDDNNESSKPLEVRDGEGNTEKFYPDGRRETWYPNGNVKKVSADGKLSKTIYFNGDVKEISTDLKMVKYFYAESNIWLSEYENGLQIVEFPNGQVEKRLKGESVEVKYPNGTTYSVTASGDKVWVNLDGTTIVHYANRDEKKIFFPNKQIETHTAEYKKREYPDGTIKTIYINGMQETKYPNGRIRLKTKDGRLLSDSEVT